MPLRLPPLSALRFFEAAGRHLSFKKAAEELNITPGAVSHGIAALEQALGAPLFVRETRKLTLTPEGADFLPYVAEAFSLIAIGARRLPGHAGGRPIAVSCAPTFASRWLLPRLAAFRERWPGVQVTVNTSSRRVGFPVDGFDLAIRLSRASQAGESWCRLFSERFLPVCAPALRARVVDGDGRFDPRAAPLIHVTSVSEDWAAWAAAAGVDWVAPPDGEGGEGGLRVDTIQLALDAAVAGLGVALGRRPFVDRELAEGALVAVGPEVEAPESAYWLVGVEGADRRPDLRAFRRWLVAQAREVVWPANE